MPDREWWAALWPDPAGLLRALGIEPGMTVVDLCCGDGYFTAPLSRLVAGKLYAVDIDPGMLQRAQDEVRRTGAPRCHWIVGDARDLPILVPRQIDFVLLANTFHGVPDKPAIARAVAAVLKSNGRFGIINWQPLLRERTVVLGQPRGPKTEMRMSPEQVQATVEPAGFTRGRMVALPPYHYGIIFVLEPP